MLQINNVQKTILLHNNAASKPVLTPSFSSEPIQDTFTKNKTPKRELSFSGLTDVFKHRNAKSLMKKDKALKFNVEHAMQGHLWAVRNLKNSDHLEAVKPYIVEELIKNTAKAPNQYKAQVLTDLGATKQIAQTYIETYGQLKQNQDTHQGILSLLGVPNLSDPKTVIKLLISDTNPLKAQAIDEYLTVATEILDIKKENLVITHEKMLAVKVIKDYGNSIKDVDTLKAALTNPKTPHYAYPSIGTGIGTLMTRINPTEKVKEAQVNDLRSIANQHHDKNTDLSNKIVTACYTAIEMIKGRL